MIEVTDAVPVTPVTSTVHTHTVFGFKEDTRTSVSWLGNLLWIWLAGGLVIAGVYAVFGLLLICTIVLAPFGFQLLKLAELALFPFGKTVESFSCSNAFEATLDIVLNILWLPVGIILLAWHLIMGILCACTCYGIIFSFQHLKLAQMALFPFGSRESHEVEYTHTFATTHTTTRYEDILPKQSHYGAVPTSSGKV